jgi:hypothetical protein
MTMVDLSREVRLLPCPKSSETAQPMLTDGVDLRGGKLRPWYEREES